MDPLDDDPEREQARRAMGVTLSLARRFDLAAMTPAGDGCLAGRRERLVYLPRGPRKIDLSSCRSAEWIDPVSGERFSTPGRNSPIVLAIKS